MLQGLQSAREVWTHPPALVLISRAQPEQIEGFVASHGDGSPVLTISDPEGRWARQFGIGRASLWQLFGWRTVLAGLRAWLRGHRVSRPTRDPFSMPGYVLLNNGAEVWRFQPRHAGEMPDWRSEPWSTS